MKEKRIAIDLPLPSIAIKNFLEKILQDDNFFAFALENPMGAMKECGVNLNISAFLPSDFATFFGAVAGLKEILRKMGEKDFSFENIFGKTAEIRGSILEAELTQGFFREWDNREAFREKLKCFAANRNFELDRTKYTKTLLDIVREKLIEIESGRFQQIQRVSEIHRDIISERFPQSETNNHTRTEWNKDSISQSQSRSDSGVNKNFEKDGKRSFEDLMQGPLIDPVDLASISARLETYTQMLK
jgi:hypothetical protein